MASSASAPASTALPTAQLQALRRAVLGFGRSSLRDLPWRATRDPWAVLVSELMLQQTQASRVVAPYRAFLERFPTAAACAGAPLGDVLRAWAGLGYNRRASNLHAAARAMVTRHGGVVPDSLPELLALPGIGPYTARAVLAFAYERDVAVVDVNVGRVLARAVAGRRLAPAERQGLADTVLPAGCAWEWNQAVLEIGAVCCTARSPRCRECPLGRTCRWAREGRAAPDPAAPGSRQSRFAGSDRQGRGRLVDALRRGPVGPSELAAACGWLGDRERAERIAAGLVGEGLVRRGPGGVLRLP
ncbi:MAG TPA: A/G-specific adenine glycosylase [Acidimicrobiales bacterium]|nr:A/G-specific adenine glycosylase [Acidimicrobiales bacterium]